MPLISFGMKNEYIFIGRNSQNSFEFLIIEEDLVLNNEKYFLLIGYDDKR